jgi:hypothetical protein
MYYLIPVTDQIFEIYRLFNGCEMIFTGLVAQADKGGWQVVSDPDYYKHDYPAAPGKYCNSLLELLAVVKEAYLGGR